MLEIDLSELDALIKKFRNDDKISDIIESEFLNMLGRITEKTQGQQNHKFINRTFLLEGSVDYFLEDNIGYILSEDVEYNSYVYYGSNRHNTSWPGDPWIRNVYLREKDTELEQYKRDLTEELYGYLT